MEHKVYLTKEVDFHTGHVLDGHDGNCKFVHGHNYHLKATFEGAIQEGRPSLVENMAVDFYHISEMVMNDVSEVYDHSFIVSEYADKRGTSSKVEKLLIDENLKITPLKGFGCATAEAMVVDMWNRLQEGLDKRNLQGILKLVELKLYETARASVTYRGEKS